MNILAILLVSFICICCIAILLYCINDLMQDFKKMREDLVEEAKNKRKKRRRW
jgi:hypothetical protein